jgi:DNA-binding response OmpR family regulator
MKILLVEDDIALAQGLKSALVREHFVVNWVAKGRDALLVIATELPDIVVLDIGLPDINGLQVLKQLRISQPNLPVLLLTARDSIEDKVSGLDSGADDYLTKPFDMQELFARLRMLGRRSVAAVSSKITIGAICMDTASYQVTCDKETIELSRREYMLLQTLMENKGRVQTRDHLETKLYSWGEEISSNSIQVHIHNLRKKLTPNFITTIRGIGYIVKG